LVNQDLKDKISQEQGIKATDAIKELKEVLSQDVDQIKTKLDELKAPLSKKTIDYLKEQGIIMDAIIQFELKEVKIIDEKSETA